MWVVGLPGAFYQAPRLRVQGPSPKAQERLRWLLAWEGMWEKGLSSAEAALTLRLARSTLYRRRKRYREQGPWGCSIGAGAPGR
jgi:hypothetical protein